MIWLTDPANTIIDPGKYCAVRSTQKGSSSGRPSLKLAAVGHEDEDACTQEQYS
jgi:hypothetical protein